MAQIFVCLARMHHISNPAKFRRLKRGALTSGVCGLVKAGKPGVLLFEGSASSVNRFLTTVKGLRYLDFHHLDTQPLLQPKMALVAGQAGLREVNHMSALLDAADMLQMKQWFRREMGMTGPG